MAVCTTKGAHEAENWECTSLIKGWYTIFSVAALTKEKVYDVFHKFVFVVDLRTLYNRLINAPPFTVTSQVEQPIIPCEVLRLAWSWSHLKTLDTQVSKFMQTSLSRKVFCYQK